MRKIEIINIEKAKNNGHCYLEMQVSNEGQPSSRRYSFRVASCKASYGGVMIDTLTSRPVPFEHFDTYCWDFEALDSQSERDRGEMMAEFRRQACG
jgi:hypothetical protein